LLIGNEGSGIHPMLNQYIQQRLFIPRVGQAESLNAAMACGIITHQLILG
jgi:TrmH family RNA methyltransferase